MTVAVGPVVIMGVSGSGKTTVGAALAARLDVPFIEGDALHPPANIAKMSQGIALADADRWPWLEAIGGALAAAGGGAVATCSALKRSYRDRLRATAGGGVRFVFLDVSAAELERRMRLRKGHFMPPALFASQLATLEPPAGETGVLVIDGAAPIAESVAAAEAWLRDEDTRSRRGGSA